MRRTIVGNESKQEVLDFQQLCESQNQNTFSNMEKFNSSTNQNDGDSKCINIVDQKLFRIDDIVIYEREEIIPIFRRPMTTAESSSSHSSPVDEKLCK